MARKLLKISYLGTAYCGWQVQNNGISVQKTVQDALEKIICQRVSITGCSRTDSGVHANEFYCHFDYEGAIPDFGIVRGMNSKLPCDIAVLDCNSVSDDFHARYSAKGKNYIYKIYESKTPNPFLSGRALQIERSLDLQAMNKFCNGIMGTHDFCGFCSSGSTVKDTVRTVSECYIERKNGITVFSVTANGFLYNMVRIFVGTAIDISFGKIDANETENIINSKRRELAGKTAPPYGLYLNKVFY